MALTFTLDSGFPKRIGHIKESRGTIAFATYSTGGDAVTAAMCGFNTYLYGLTIEGGAEGYKLEWDGANSKIKVLMPAGAPRVLNPGEAERDLSAAAADVTTFHVSRDCYVVGVSSVVTTLVAADTTVPVMSVEKRDADGSSNAVELATITYADTDAVGTLDSYFTSGGATGGGATVSSALATPYAVDAGETLVLKHKTQAADGSSAAGGAKVHIWIADFIGDLELDNGYDLSGLTAVRFSASGW